MNVIDWTCDIDGDGEALALTDGLLVFRYLFGYPGTYPDIWIGGAVDTVNGSRITASEIEAYIVEGFDILDIDGDCETLALTDGLLVFRYLFGYPGTYPDIWIGGAVDTVNGTRTSAAEIEAYIESIKP